MSADLVQTGSFVLRRVLVFPPFNGFRRFLIHKLIEDNFASSEVAAFSIGQDISRRIVICYKGLISNAASQGLPATIPQSSKQIMIDKEKQNRQRQTPTAAVYRPPAARQADIRKSTDVSKPQDSKYSRVRRPDQQVYVPRPKRASYDNSLPRSRSRSNSRLSLDSDHSIDIVRINSEEPRDPHQNGVSNDCRRENIQSPSSILQGEDRPDISTENKSEESPRETNFAIKNNEGVFDVNNAKLETPEFIEASEKVIENETCVIEAGAFDKTGSQHEVTDSILQICGPNSEKNGGIQDDNQTDIHSVEDAEVKEKFNIGIDTHSLTNQSKNEDKKDEVAPIKTEATKLEVMETVSISSESTTDESSCSSYRSCSDSNTSSSRDNDVDYKNLQKCRSSEKMEIDYFEEKNVKNQMKSKSEQKEKKKTTTEPSATISEVLVISDSSSSNDCMKSTGKNKKNKTPENKKNEHSTKAYDVKDKKVTKQSMINPNECDWESLYDDSGECLVPSLMEELTKSVGKVRVTSADSDYRPYQSIEERTNDGESVIEIYDFPAEFKTTDLFNVFAAYSNKNFQIKWVDDTHALGVFPSPVIADEVLSCTLPYVKTRPLRLAIAESRIKARNLVLPPLPSVERPKTCSALAKRLVSGALGLRIPTSSQEREKEKQVLKEAREKRRLEAKQREAAWNGTIASNSVI